jgi:hypothetical protein
MSTVFGKSERESESRTRIHISSRRAIDGHVTPLAFRALTDFDRYLDSVSFGKFIIAFIKSLLVFHRTETSSIGLTPSFPIT